MFRSTLLYLSNQPRVFRFVRNNKLAKKFASRFVAGETLDEALAAVRDLNAKGITASLDLLGESVHNEREARQTGTDYITILDRIHQQKLDANVSLKLTAMGLDISEELCISIMHDVLSRAQQYNTFVRLDMESSQYTEKTLELFYDRLYPAYKDNVGIVLQSYLYRTWSDVEKSIQAKCRVRLCKGAYKEPASVAFPDKKEVDQNYKKCMQALIEHGNYPGIATHDPQLIGEAKRFVYEKKLDRSRFEFQMLYGVRRDLQHELVREGYRMRVYVPFGTQWYPYLMRRLAERPANVAFITGNVMREMISPEIVMSHARYQPPDHSKGDESTIGGYMAVHDRPAAFDGSDGFSYSVEIICDLTDEREPVWGAFFLFIRWSRVGAQTPEGHLESDYLVHADTETDARRLLGEMPVTEVKVLLDRLIAERKEGAPVRRWWDAMRNSGEQE